jgi:undecaprenyl-diphosphatase
MTGTSRSRQGPDPVAEVTDNVPRPNAWWHELDALDAAGYAAIAGTPTPTLDRVFRRLSRAADHWKLWLGSAAVLAIGGGRRGRRAAVNGIAAMTVTSAAVNLVLKPLGDRRRPDRSGMHVPVARHVAMPSSTSFPSGHAANAAAFATGVATVLPEAGIPLTAAGALVAYSRVHTGVHYPVDVIAGSLAGTMLAEVTVSVLDRGRTRRSLLRRAQRPT